MVTIDEIVLMVNIALNDRLITACEAGDPDHTGTISITNLILAVNNTLHGCPAN